MAFVPRLTKPEKGNPYYTTITSGGYSLAIVGKPTDPDCNVLSNCVGYAYGRFNEIGGYGRMKYLQPVNAENFIEYAGGLKTGKTPKVGACMVWRKGPTLSNSDGAGHVAIVEKVINDTTIVTSESAYGSTAFYTMTRYKGNGNWGMNSPYTFLAFIYNPAVEEGGEQSVTSENSKWNGLPTLSVGSKGETVKALQLLLIGNGHSCGSLGADGDFGGATCQALKDYQAKKGLTADGVCGNATWSSILGL